MSTTAIHIQNESEERSSANEKNELWGLWAFAGVLATDAVASVILLTPFMASIRHALDEREHFTLYGSLGDLAILSGLRLFVAVLGLSIAYFRADEPLEYPFELTHPSGDKKSREELEEEALEEDLWPWLVRFVARPSFPCELAGILTQILCVVKSMARMEVELDRFQSKHRMHPLFWIVVLFVAALSLIEACYLDSMCKLAGKCGKGRFSDLLLTVDSALRTPLLDSEEDNENPDERTDSDVEADAANSDDSDSTEVRGVSDIGADAAYKATWKDLLLTCAPDLPLLFCAFIFLILAAISEVCIPRFLGKILDSLTETFTGADDDATHEMSMFDVPGFMENVRLLLIASIAAGVFSGLRAAIFTIAGGRVNVRLRIQLMDALLSQDIGFFDMTKTGDITSRLSSDTTLVGNQATRSVDVFFKCIVHCLGILTFMFVSSWQLTIFALISFPVITIVSKWYGNYMRALSKLMQKKLADGNSVSEAALGSMATVRSFDAAESELQEFEKIMQSYLRLNSRDALAFGSLVVFLDAVPQLVYAVVVFYGGLLVRNGVLTGGELVSFLLYLQSLSNEFAAIGWVFGSLTQAAGAADKVFELMHRKTKYTQPTSTATASSEASADQPTAGVLGIKASKTRQQRTNGLRPEHARGEIVLDNVEMYYPARPQRRILNGLSLKVEPGSVVALVGSSGGGKSSVMSLIQHLYEPSAGKVLFDGIDVHELSPAFLSRHVSIVSQEPTLFARSIKRNIMYGLEGTDAEPTDEEILEAAKLANADDFIQRMPQK